MVLRDHLFSVNLVSKPRMLSVRTVYVLGSLHLVEARFRAKYDDRVLLAERPIIVALLKPPRWHATLELRYFC